MLVSCRGHHCTTSSSASNFHFCKMQDSLQEENGPSLYSLPLSPIKANVAWIRNIPNRLIFWSLVSWVRVLFWETLESLGVRASLLEMDQLGQAFEGDTHPTSRSVLYVLVCWDVNRICHMLLPSRAEPLYYTCNDRLKLWNPELKHTFPPLNCLHQVSCSQRDGDNTGGLEDFRMQMAAWGG